MNGDGLELSRALDACLEDRATAAQTKRIEALMRDLVLNRYGADEQFHTMLRFSERLPRRFVGDNWDPMAEWLANKAIRLRHHRQREQKDLESHLPFHDLKRLCKWLRSEEHAREFASADRDRRNRL